MHVCVGGDKNVFWGGGGGFNTEQRVAYFHSLVFWLPII